MDVENLKGDVSQKTLGEIAAEFTVELMIENPGMTEEEAKKRTAEVIAEITKGSKFAGLASLLLNIPRKLNRHERRRESKLKQKVSTRK